MSRTLSPTADDALREPVPDRRPPASRARLWTALTLLVGLLGTVLALAVPLAPVVADRTVVSWPAAGEQPVSTTAFFVPYRPAELHVAVPCPAVQAGLGRSERTTLVATTVAPPGGSTSALVVATEGGRLQVLVGGRLVRDEAPAATGCDVRVDADDAGTTVASGSAPPTALPGEPVPDVFAFVTDLDPDQAADTTVTARTRTWFESRPSTLKTAVIAGHALLVLLSLALLARQGPQAARVARERVPRRALRVLADVAVVAVLSGWVLIAPQTDDDGYATMTIRNALESGDVGNYYHWMNASEAPFTLVQRLVEPLVALTLEPVWLRLPSYLAGVATWFVVSRGVLGAALPGLGRRPVVRWAAALCFLAWWLPFDLGVRPEPFVALAAASVLALLLRGTAPGARRPLPTIGAAALVAGVAVAVTPSSVVVLAPVLVLLPRTWRTLRAGTGGAWAPLLGRVALLGCLAGTGLVVMFADQSWHGVAKATELHTRIGPNLAWYEEVVRYAALMNGGGQGTTTKRVPVLVTLALLVVTGLLLARRLPRPRVAPTAHLVAGSTALAFVVLALTPSKWTHHFGAVVGLAVPFLVVAGVLLVQSARQRAHDRGVVAIGLVGAGLLALAVGVGLSGANGWFLYSDYGLPYRDVPVRPLGVPLGNPVPWLLLAAVAAAVVVRLRWRPGRGRAATAAVLLPVPLAAAGLAAGVLVLVGTFTVAPLRQAAAGSYSLTAVNLAAVTGDTCGLADAVQVLADDPDGPLEPTAGEDAVAGFVSGGGWPSSSPPPAAPGSGPATSVWGSLDGGELSTGTLTSAWFALPALSGEQDLTVSAAGRTGGANVLELEFGRSDDGGGVTALERRPLGDGAAGASAWRPLSVTADAVPAGADRVRVLATDAATDAGGWLAVTGPRVRSAEGLQEFLAGRGTVLPEWPLSWHFPCVRDVPVVADGLAETPDVLLAAPSAYSGLAAIAYAPGQGGSFAGIALAARQEAPSRLAGTAQEDWGSVQLLDYRMARDAYDRRTDQVQLWGWQGDR
ncbi:arabinosyltransferase C [Geodermatophilus tzadiensis]|uniref:Arabinosyltransferase C n=1 Tax=Geodermatophilus tzadiensis TaxID=1137988 RepID=A0A2T0U207_9ACTN|nr:arabinosyltransferase domain-containing protein [Geodermatophilus tzadiensis]PRY51933.1 arabinosyltransferase C [Geodermatophilus tzadiensis]